MFNLSKKPEILAPAGSMEALKATVYYGADAVYLGGLSYGARAFANNFDETELIRAIDYAHLYGVKVYLTVNTLFRNDEINCLFSYLKPYYEVGLDAVIVQDLGVMEYIHDKFPEIPIHASTQMSITTPYSFEILKDYGITRIVPARELSIEEIRDLKTCDYGNGYKAPELEVFVQGALCFCYSGHCLISSFIGGRSGNRGRCAQSCRLPYSLYDGEGRKIKTDGDYILSPKDLFGLKAVPDLIDAGVDSFKIEGRMKKPEYVAACTKSYRKCVDYIYEKLSDYYDNNMGKDIDYNSLLCDNIKLGDEYAGLINECKEEMASVFNRGGFTAGYYCRKNGREMMSMHSPGHMGIDVGKIRAIKNNQIVVKLRKSVNKGDIFVIRDVTPEITLTCNVDGINGSEIILNVPRSKEIQCGTDIYRMFDNVLNNYLSKYKYSDRKIPVSGTIALKVGQPANMQISAGNIIIEHEGPIVERASSKPVSEDVVKEKLNQTGETYFEFEDLSILMDKDVFYPMKALKQLRRDCFEKLEEAIRSVYKRETVTNSGHNIMGLFDVPDIKDANKMHIIVSSKDQLDIINNYPKILNDSVISMDLQYFSKRDIMEIAAKHSDYGLVLPMILRRKAIEELNEISLNDFSMVIVRNVDELAYLKHLKYQGNIVIDYSLYVMNDYAAHFIRSQFPEAIITLPVELNKSQLKEMSYISSGSEWIVYNHQPLMVSAQCFKENSSVCNNDYSINNSLILKDSTKHSFFVKTICKYCYNIVLNGVPTVLFDQSLIDDNKDIPHKNLRRRIQLSIEDVSETSKLMSYLNNMEIYDYNSADYRINDLPFKNYTRGHYKRGAI